MVNSVTGEPIRRALVNLSGVSPRYSFTDSEGRFSFEDVPAVRVMLQASRPGYFMHYDRPTFVDLSKSSDAITLELIPSAVISGQVIGADDQPLERAPIEIFESQIIEGRRRWAQRGMRMTDEDGKFRIPDLRPGMYKVSAGPLRDMDLQAAGLGYTKTYYPQSLNRASAGVVALSAAQTMEINFKLRPVRVYKVAGRVTGEMGRGAGVNVSDDSDVPMQAPTRVDFLTGAFELMLPAGSYTLRAIASDGKGQLTRARASVAVTSDVTGVTLALAPALSIPVVVHRDFVKTSQTQSLDPQRSNLIGASVRLYSTSDGQVRAGGYAMPGQTPDTAVVGNVEAGTYEVDAMPQGAWSGNLYIASVSYGTKDLLREPLTITGSRDADAIDVVIKDDGAMLEGTVRGASDGGQVVIVSDTNPKRRFMGSHSPEGRLYSPVLPPGAYMVYAFDHTELVEYANPEALERYSSKAAHVSVSAGQTARLTLDLIEVQP